ncbi:MAG: hypothetical protein JXA21_05590 [Anaerolineae bacterium]|nr:hypothetical protein [Anaerolineae bacterium]
MKKERIFAGVFVLGGLILGLALTLRLSALATPLLRTPQPQSPAAVQAPMTSGFTYQGVLRVTGESVNGVCSMAFRLFDADTSGAQAGNTITRTVTITEGLFTETLDFGEAAFNGDARWLDIQVRCEGDTDFVSLGRQAITAVPYALYAQKTQGYANVLVVAESGGDYTSVQAAVDSIDAASVVNPYLVWVAPGVYSESVVLKPYIHLQGAGQGATIITSTVSNDSSVTMATVVLTHHVSVRDLTVVNTGIFTDNVALLANDGATATLISDVTARTSGGGIDADYNMALYLTGGRTSATLLRVTALAANGKINRGLLCTGGASAYVHGGTFVGRGGNSAYGIQVSSADTRLEAEDVISLGEGSSNLNYGLYAGYSATATLKGGSFTARGGSVAYGLYNGGFTGAVLYAENVSALGEAADNTNAGVETSYIATLRGGTFTGRGGSYAYGIHNVGGAARLRASGITAVAEDGLSRSAGFCSESTAQAWIESSRITGSSNALRLQSSALHLAVSQLDGSVNNTSSALTCFQVYDNYYAAHSCNP